MKNNKKGFTLAELLIVVAIIAVLVAISIPIFTAQLRKARLATNQANARAAYAATVADMLDKSYTQGTGTYDVATAKATTTSTATTGLNNTAITTWKDTDTIGSVVLGETTAKTWTVSVDADGNVSFGAKK